MIRRLSSLVLLCLLVAAGWTGVRAQSATWAIRGARIVPVGGPPIESGTLVMRDGVIAAIGAAAAVPPGAQVIDGAGLTVYPGLIDMGSTAGLAMPPVPRAENPRTTEDVERVKVEYLRRPHFKAADVLNPGSRELREAAASGITATLATPSGGALHGQSALISTALPPDAPQIGAMADPRKAPLVLRTPVALHVSFPERPGGGPAYPTSLMGVIAFVRQTMLDAQHFGKAAGGQGSSYDPALEALQPALAGRLPVVFEANTAVEILRALDMAKAFSLQPVIAGGGEADRVAAELKAAQARVIVSLDFPTRSESLPPDEDESIETLRQRAHAPAVPAALDKAGVPFVFASAGLDKIEDFRKHAARTVASGLNRERALAALTTDAAKMAGVGDTIGTLATGRMANVLVMRGDLFDEKAAVAHVFVHGWPIDLETAASRPTRP